jgi:hypothetical protein
MENIKVIVDRSDLVAIADAVRDKTDVTDGLTLGEIASSISSIDTCDLPTLTDSAAAGDIASGKEAIDGSGNKITGTFTIDNELTIQDNLISQIQTALQGKTASGAIPDEYVDVSSATALESDVMYGKTFGAGSSLKTGTFTIDDELIEQDNLISQIQVTLQSKLSA